MVSSSAGNALNLTWLQRFAEFITNNEDVQGVYTIHLCEAFTFNLRVTPGGIIQIDVLNNENDDIFVISINKNTKEGAVVASTINYEPVVNFKLDSSDINDGEYVNIPNAAFTAICPIDEDDGMWLSVVYDGVVSDALQLKLSSCLFELKGVNDIIKFGFDYANPVVNNPSTDANHNVTLIQVP